MSGRKIAVVIPCYRVKDKIVDVVNGALRFADYVVVVDDTCPEESGKWLKENIKHEKVHVLFNEKNLGVGGAVLRGFSYGAEMGADVLVKIDGDGQMDPNLIDHFAGPILVGEADYTKGNRFTSPEALKGMPLVRLLGNAGLSFLSKASTGYWGLMDPTNGYVAISADIFEMLPVSKISSRYFFESDLLFRLNFVGARVCQIPMRALYADEKSSLSVSKSLFEFGFKNVSNFIKRILYSYFILDFNLGSIALVFGLCMLLTGFLIGQYYWIDSIFSGHLATNGQVMMAALPTLLGFQSIFFFFSIDVANSLHRTTSNNRRM